MTAEAPPRNTTPCDSCGQPIEWGRVIATDRPIPLDPGERPDGNLAVLDENGKLLVRFLR
jgi:hypothetical protein